MVELGAALAATVLCFGLFRLLAVSWPRLYYGPTDGLAIFLSASLPLFAAFRILPVAAIATAGAAYVLKLNGSVGGFMGAFIGIYVGSLAVFRFGRRIKYGRRFSLRDALWLLAAALLSTCGILLGGIAAPAVKDLFPGVAVSRDALFTALLVSMLVEFFRRLRLEEDVTERAIRNAIAANHAMVDALELEAHCRGIDRWVIPAIFVAEQMQRPKWFQSAERVAYSVGLPVTVGPFQGRRDYAGTASAQASAFLDGSAAASLASRVTLEEMWVTPGTEAAIYALHNNSQPFVSLCMQVRESLISLEFLSGATPFQLDELNVELGLLRISPRYPAEFMFDIHLKSDADDRVSLRFGPAAFIEDAESVQLHPGATQRVYVDASIASEPWKVIAASDPPVEATFTPVVDLEFEATWKG